MITFNGVNIRMGKGASLPVISPVDLVPSILLSKILTELSEHPTPS